MRRLLPEPDRLGMCIILFLVSVHLHLIFIHRKLAACNIATPPATIINNSPVIAAPIVAHSVGPITVYLTECPVTTTVTTFGVPHTLTTTSLTTVTVSCPALPLPTSTLPPIASSPRLTIFNPPPTTFSPPPTTFTLPQSCPSPPPITYTISFSTETVKAASAFVGPAIAATVIAGLVFLLETYKYFKRDTWYPRQSPSPVTASSPTGSSSTTIVNPT